MAGLLPLREDLDIFPGPNDRQGAPTWSLHDPGKNRFFNLDWASFEILQRWHMQDTGAISSAVNQHTTLQIDETDVDNLQRFLQHNELLNSHSANYSAWLRERVQERQQSVLKRLFHSYLFLRIPLLNPNHWLGRIAPAGFRLWSSATLWLSIAAGLFGLIGFSQHSAAFSQGVTDLLAWHNLPLLLLSLALVKSLHELGHAIVAKHYGCEVPSMGVALMVGVPVAYTDVSDAWRLKKSKARLHIGLAGIQSELLIAAWASFAWQFLPAGDLKQAVLLVATSTWLSSLVINASPFMRFDGYFVLMDLLELPNLHQRSFALGRWHLANSLGISHSTPPEHFSPPLRRGLILFAYLTWLYRAALFCGIALLLATQLPSPLGPLLGTIELWFFILRPLLNTRLQGSAEPRPKRRISKRLVALILLPALILLLPWDNRIRSAGVLAPSQIQAMTTLQAGQLQGTPPRHNQQYANNATIVLMRSPALNQDRDINAIKRSTAARSVQQDSVNPQRRGNYRVTIANQSLASTQSQGLDQLAAALNVNAPFDGRFVKSGGDTNNGNWLPQNYLLGKHIAMTQWSVSTYLPTTSIERLALGDEGWFYLPGTMTALRVRIDHIDIDSTHNLPEPLLEAQNGGPVKTRDRAIPDLPHFRVQLSVIDALPGYLNETPMKVRGQLTLVGERSMWLDDIYRSVLRFLMQISKV